ALERVGCNAPAVAQAAGEFAVVHRTAAEGGLGQAALTAEFADLLKNLLVHDGVSIPALKGRSGRKPTKSCPFRQWLGKMGKVGGQADERKMAAFQETKSNAPG